MRLAAAVVLFHPDETVVPNIQSYNAFVDVVIAVDNSVTKNDEVVKSLQGIKNLVYLPNEKNLGIAAALNIAAKHSYEQGFTWLLTMDQDSSFDSEEFKLYKKQVLEFIKNESKIGLICPSEVKKSEGLQITEPAFRITSGTWINLHVWQQVHGFDEQLFIDEVDKDFSCKVFLADFRLIGFDNVLMKHKLGTKKNTGFLKLFFVKERTLHSPFRLYYMVRNYLVVRKRYGKYFPDIFKKRDRDFMIMLKNNIFFGGNFFYAVFQAAKGFVHYKRNKF